VFATGNRRKTDPVDTHSVAMVALRSPGLVHVEAGDDLVVMGMRYRYLLSLWRSVSISWAAAWPNSAESSSVSCRYAVKTWWPEFQFRLPWRWASSRRFSTARPE
jgi:hypothetical protein